jgi:hypothetical protein
MNQTEDRADGTATTPAPSASPWRTSPQPCATATPP